MKFRVVLIERLPWDGANTPWSKHSWYWRLMSAGNNKILAHSEWYNTKRDAVKAAGELADALGVILEEITD